MLVARVLRSHTGGGPSRSRTIIDDDLITVVLEGTLSAGERTLIASGKHNIFRSARKALDEIQRDELIAGVEQPTGRTVIASFSDHAIDRDIAVEAFLLAPPAS